MEWGWPQWVVAIFFVLRLCGIIIKSKNDDEIGSGVTIFAIAIVCGVIYALHAGGFW